MDREAILYDTLGERYGWTPRQIAQMHPSELKLYLRGRKEREEMKKRQQQSRQRSVSADQRRREQEALKSYQ